MTTTSRAPLASNGIEGCTMHSSSNQQPIDDDTTTKLLIALQWLLTFIGIFCLVGVAVVIATTPEAWPL